MGNAAKNVLTFLCSVAIALLGAEVTLRFLPVNEGLRLQPVNEASPVAHFEPDRTSTWSRFADFSMVNTVHSNNYGFINDQDYNPDAPEPLIAVIGDSFVEASMVPYAQTVQGRLAKALQGQWRVYSFGVSGAPLSQYLAMARFVRDTFKPERIYIVIVGNDFDESLMKYKTSPGFHYFEEVDGTLRLTRRDYSPTLMTRIARNSQLAMYLMINASIHHSLAAMVKQAKNKRQQGNTDASTGPVRIADSIRATDSFLSMLPHATGLAPEAICLVVDAVRPDVYTSLNPKDGFFSRMRTYLLSSAGDRGFRTIDLHAFFYQEFALEGIPFEYIKDGHWSGHGHEACAKAILQAGIAPPPVSQCRPQRILGGAQHRINRKM